MIATDPATVEAAAIALYQAAAGNARWYALDDDRRTLWLEYAKAALDGANRHLQGHPKADQ